MKRGGVALNTKVRYAQEAGALAVLILNSNCTRERDGLRCAAEAKEKAYGIEESQCDSITLRYTFRAFQGKVWAPFLNTSFVCQEKLRRCRSPDLVSD